jgi:3-oxoacyl-[acyl-carrier protein] reductase
MAGMYLPGRNVVVGEMRSRFPAPLFYPNEVSVNGEIVSWVPSTQGGILRVRVIETASGTLTAETHVSFTLHEKASAETGPRETKHPMHSGRPLVAVTGASGGLGREIVKHLESHYDVTPMSRQEGPDTLLADLSSDDWEATANAGLGDRKLYGLVHCAWPSAPRGGLLESELEIVSRQVLFGSTTTIRLAKWLSEHTEGPARLVLLGSTAATQTPVLNLGAYSLGKAVLEHSMRLLAPELPRKGVTVNAVLPSFIPVGMNAAKSSRAVLLETAKVPAGRLGSPADVANAIEYLLSPGASFVSGQLVSLTGGQM